MDQIYDFNRADDDYLTFDGASDKLGMTLDGVPYIVKFGEAISSRKNNRLRASYRSTPFSEYLACHIFDALGIPVQKTVLGTFGASGRKVVGCQDFVRSSSRSLRLVPFKQFVIGRTTEESARKRPVDLALALDIISRQPEFELIRAEAMERIWETFIVDALTGNFDRHAGNWGYLMDMSAHRFVETAPVYDCGSSFTPMLDEEAMARLLGDITAQTQRVLAFPNSQFGHGGEPYGYLELLLAPEGKACRHTLLRLAQRICSLDFHGIVGEMPMASAIRKSFYLSSVIVRRAAILGPAYQLACEEEGTEPLEDFSCGIDEMACLKSVDGQVVDKLTGKSPF